MHIYGEKNQAPCVSLSISGRIARRRCHESSGRQRPHPRCDRSHAGRASASFAVPASVIVTSFSRRSFPLRTATHRAFTSGRRLRVSVVSSSDVSPLRSPCRTWPDLRKEVEQRVLGRAQADAAQLLVIEPADGSRRLTQGAAKAAGRIWGVVLSAHIRCICSDLVVVKGRAVDLVLFPGLSEVSPSVQGMIFIRKDAAMGQDGHACMASAETSRNSFSVAPLAD